MKKIDFKNMSKKKKIWMLAVLVLLILIIVAVILFAVKKSDQTDAETTTATAQTMTIEKTLSSDGEITSTLEENKQPHTSYYLKKINVSEGDALDEGDTILTYTNGYKMTAPYDCVVESWYLPDVGDQLTTSHYVTIAGTDVMQMELSVSEDEISLLEKGETAAITVDAIDKTYEGEVSHISEVGDYTDGTSTFTADVAFDNDGKLMLGMTGTAEISLEKAENVIGIPVDAVHVTNNENYVTVQNGDETSEVAVETGISNDSYIEIKSGLSAGDVVVVPVSSEDSSSGSNQMNMPGGGGSMPSGGGSMPSGGGSMPSGGGQQNGN